MCVCESVYLYKLLLLLFFSSLHSAVNKCRIVVETLDILVLLLSNVSLFKQTVHVAAGACAAYVHVYTCALVHVCVLRERETGEEKKKEEKKERERGQVSIP